MATTSSTKGNMYVVKDGKCVQSFWNGQFSATVEKKEPNADGTVDAVPMKQEWTLVYTSLQKCAADAEKDYTVTFNGKCAAENTTTSITLAE